MCTELVLRCHFMHLLFISMPIDASESLFAATER
jgi:hypothetical protein